MKLFPSEIYINRRDSLIKRLDDGIILFLGSQDVPINFPSNSYRFRQDSSFLYFFGLNEPNLAATINIFTGETIIWGNDADIDDIIWMGPQPLLKEKSLSIGVECTRPLSRLTGYIQANSKKIHFLPPYRASTKLWLQELTGMSLSKIIKNTSSRLIKACVTLRSVKEPCEIEHIKNQMDYAYLMHTSAMHMAKEGVVEQEIVGCIEGISLSGGGATSFPTILTINGQTLHNHFHGNILRKNDLMLVDAGSSSFLNYATDHTRTSPIGGFFTQQQKEIYQIVLDANNFARSLSKPGVRYLDVHLKTAQQITLGLKNLGLMKGDVEEAVSVGAHALFMPHGLGHMMGLDVHDMEDYGEDYVGYDETIVRSSQFGLNTLRLARELKEGFVITDEPGIYFIPELIALWNKDKKHESFINYEKVTKYLSFGGIRLEDDLLIEKDGASILGKRIPITIEEVEQEVQKR